MSLTTNHYQATTSRVVSLVNVRQLEAGTLSLMEGVLVYVFARSDGILFLPRSFDIDHTFSTSVHDLAGPLAVFSHVSGPALLSSAAPTPGRSTAVSVCSG